MFSGLRPYDDTAATDVPWLGDAPRHWEVLPGAGVLRPVSARNQDLREDVVLSLSYGRVVVKPAEKLRGLVPASFETYQLLEPGNIVVRPTDLQNDQTSVRVGLVRDHGMITSAYLGFAAATGVVPEFIYSYLATLDAMKVFYGMGSGLRQNLEWSDFKRLPVLLPPAAEQSAIVKYLTHAHARIDRAIVAKRRLGHLIDEKRQATTRSLLSFTSDGSPAAWEHVPAGRLCKITTGVEDSGNADPDGEYPFFVRGREILRASDYLMDAEAVMTPGDGQGGVGKVFHYFKGKFQAHQRVYIFSDFDRVDGRFFYWHLSTFFRRFALSQSNTVTMESLRLPVLASFPVAVPSLTEQRRIVDLIEAEDARAHAVRLTVQREIELLREFRIRLTSDVVTGQLDVRHIAATLPDAEPAVVPGDVFASDDDLLSDAGEPLEEVDV